MRCHCFKVRWIDAVADIAQVINLQAIRYRSDKQLVREAVGKV
jgi:hypothetical protein